MNGPFASGDSVRFLADVRAGIRNGSWRLSLRSRK